MAITFNRSGAGTVGVASFAVAPAGAAPPSPDRAQAGALLVQLFQYVERHLDGHPGLTPAIAALRDALAAYRTSGGDPFGGVRTVVAVIQSARASDPALPEP